VNSVFIGNLDYKATDEELKDVFKDFGEFEVDIHKNKGGKPLGFAHVHFTNLENAQAAAEKLKTQVIEINGRKLRIDLAKPKK
jgi:RNA recognition motif-containing protein